MGIIVYGADWCADCHRVKNLFDKNKVEYEYRDIDSGDAIKNEMLAKNGGSNSIPTIDIDGKILVDPETAELKKELNLEGDDVASHEVIMIGAGPTSLAAAVYTTREDIETVLIEKGAIGGLAAVTDWVDNYPGFPDGIAGLELADKLTKQAERFGAKIELNEVTGILDGDKVIGVQTVEGTLYAKAVLVATGSDYRKLGIPGETEFYGRGVHYCATCDGAFYRDKKLVVVGGGNSAVQEAIFLTKFATHIDLLVRSKISASEILQEELKKHTDKITVHLGVTTDEIVGEDNKVVKVIGTDTSTNGKKEFQTDGVFVFVGLLPNTGFLNGALELDELGLIKTNENLETSFKGVFAAGDVRSGATMQIASAVGEGATAALKIREYLIEKQRSEQVDS